MLDTIYLVYCDSGMYIYDALGVYADSYSDDRLIAAFSSKQDALDYCSKMHHAYIETEEKNSYSELWRRYYVRKIPVN